MIYVSNIPFQYNERDGRYSEFIGDPTGTIFVAAKRDHQFSLSQRSNKPNMSINLNNSRQLNVNENLTQIAPTNANDTSHHTYHAQEQDADVEYLGRVKIALSSHMGSINFADPANIRNVHEELMTQVRTKAVHIDS